MAAKDVSNSNHNYLAVWATSIGHAYTHWFPATFYLLLPLIKDELNLTYTEMGLLITVRYVASAVANFPSGMLSDMFRRRELLMTISLIWVGLPYIFVGLSSNYNVLLLCMIIIGTGNNLWHPAAISVLSDLYPKKKGWAMGWHASAANVGDALGPFLTGILLAWMSWRAILMVSFVPGLALGVLIWWMLGEASRRAAAEEAKNILKDGAKKEKKPLSVKEYFAGLRKLIINPHVVILSLINGVRSLTQNGLSTFLPSFFMQVQHLSPWLSGVYLSVIQVAGIVAAPVSGHASDRYGRKKVTTMALFSTSIAIFLLAILDVPWLFVLFLGVVGFFLYSLRPVLFAWTMEVAPQELGGTAIGIQFTFQSVLAAVAPVVGGWIADVWSLMATFYFLAATVFISNLLVMLVKEPAHPGTESEKGV
ncbi:MAG: MFS transporter [Deltaproteobacteria bacterium]|nr:MFS transporter [Deltaproteobacteria bacterium]